jgi:DNA-binding winged helix-turn-helix (wHTH) protein
VPAEPTYGFGPFRFDPRRRRLTRGAEPVPLPDRQVDILRLLVAQAGQIVTKDALIEAAWKEVAVTDNSLEQAMSSLRRRLGNSPDGAPYIETLPRRGYRFRADVSATVARQSDDALADLLLPYRVLLEGRGAIETLGRDAVLRARAAFADVVAASPDYAPGHIGLANAHALAFEATRADETPDVQALQAALQHAREACRLDAASGEAWATLAFVLSRTGQPEAAAAGRRATALEPDNWRHHVRLAYATWGEPRLRAAREATKLLPGLALAHWLAATVLVARQALEEAARELMVGAAAQDRQQDGGRFGSVGLHLLLGLVSLARGEDEAADEALARELTFESAGHIYARQVSAHTWSAMGALRLRQGRTAEAIRAFDQALERLPAHAPTLAALSVIAEPGRRRGLRARLDARLAALDAFGAGMDAAMARGVGDVLADRHAEAAGRLLAALHSAPPGSSAGWTLPVEPLLQVAAHADAWAAVLAALRERAA